MPDGSDDLTLPPVREVDLSPVPNDDPDSTRLPVGGTESPEGFVRPVSFLGPPRRPGDIGSLGGYCIASQIGQGGMGYVFRGWDESLNRLVAVKVLRPELDVPEARERFIREAQAAAGLHHDHVVAVYGVYNPPDGIPYFTMELLLGATLAERVRPGPLPPREAADVLAQVAAGVAAVHAAGLVHRDIKPANILLDSATNRVKLADFGLARDAAVPSSLTQDGAIVGTPHYLSPEQAAGRTDQIDARTDVYALGATLYEALTGSTPFRGTVYAVLRQVQNGTPDPPRRLNGDVPRDLQVICLKAMAREPGRRYATAAQMHDDLRCWLEGRPIGARSAGTAERAMLWSRRNPVAIALLAVFLIGFATSIGGWWRAGVKADEAAASAETARNREADANASAALAIARKAEADASAALATTRQNEAVAARQLADDKARLAEEHALLALGTINTLVYTAQQLAEAAPGTLALKRQLAEAALADLRKLAASGDKVPGADRTRLSALRKLAETFLLLGRTDEAIAEYEKAVALAIALRNASPIDVSLHRDHAATLVRIAYIHRRGGERAKAADDLRRALEALIAAKELAPTDPSTARELAVIFNAVADIEQESGAPLRAIANYERALALVERLAEAEPNRWLYQTDLRYTHARLGLAHAIAMNFPVADRHYQEAEAAAARGLALDPTNPTARRDWHISLLDRADAQTRLGDYAGAEAKARQALTHLEPVARSESDNVFAQRDLAIGYSVLGVALIGIDRFEAGQKELERSLLLREKVLEQSRGSGVTTADIPVIGALLIANADRMRHYDEAAKWCDHTIESIEKAQPAAKDLAMIVTLSRLGGAKEAYLLAPKAIADPAFARSQKPEIVRLLLCVRARSIARTGKPEDALAAIDEARSAFPNDFDVLVCRACLYSQCARSTTEAVVREKRLEVALASLVEIAKQRPAWFGDIAFYPELVPARAHPAFAARVADVVRSPTSR